MASGYPAGTTASREGNNGNCEQRCRIDLGGQVFVVAKTWKEQLLIHIRKYDTEKGRTFPTIRGVTLQLRQWNDLKDNTREIDEAVTTLKQGKEVKLSCHLGNNLHVSVERPFPGIDVRQWWRCDDTKDAKPCKKKGIFLKFEQWEKLKDTFQIMEDFVPELNTVIPCAMQEDHQNQVGMHRCAFCNPNDHQNW